MLFFVFWLLPLLRDYFDAKGLIPYEIWNDEGEYIACKFAFKCLSLKLLCLSNNIGVYYSTDLATVVMSDFFAKFYLR